MKKSITLFVLLILSVMVFATPQESDRLLYNNFKLRLNTGWGHPSPLQTYFYQTGIAYPFKRLSTANYRGHIATWVIQNGRFYLKEIAIGKLVKEYVIKTDTYPPKKYGIKSKNDSYNTPDLTFADWFSGMIECDSSYDLRTRRTFYFQIRNGEIISTGEVTSNDGDRIRELSEKDTTDKELMAKKKLITLNYNYIGYYYRLNNNDEIIYNDIRCQLNTDYSRLSPIYAIYSDQHLNWPYNWENLEKSGAPHCTWKIVNDSLLLKEVQLYSGLRLDSADKERIELKSLLPGKENNGQIFADWVTGIHVVISGSDRSSVEGHKQFVPKEYTYCRIEKGIVKEAYSLPASFDRKDEKQLDPRLKKLIKEYESK